MQCGPPYFGEFVVGDMGMTFTVVVRLGSTAGLRASRLELKIGATSELHETRASSRRPPMDGGHFNSSDGSMRGRIRTLSDERGTRSLF